MGVAESSTAPLSPPAPVESSNNRPSRAVISGTAAVALAGLLAAQKATGKPIAEHKVLFLGAGEVRAACRSPPRGR